MGNEHSKGKELTKNGQIPEKHENGAVNGLSGNITSNGLEIAVNSETLALQNSEPLSLNFATESTEPDFVIVETDAPPAKVVSEVVSEVPEPTIQREEAKDSEEEKETSNKEQRDESPPAADPQPALNSSEEEAVATIIIEQQEEIQYPHEKAETSTQTDRKSEADISTQTGDDDNTAVGLAEEVVVMESATAEEDSLNDSAVTIAKEAVEEEEEEAANEEPLDNQTDGIIGELVIVENDVYENITFRAERVEVTDHFETNHCDPEEEGINGLRETEPEITTELESSPQKSITEDELVVEENKSEEGVPLEVSSSLLEVVADCVEAVFTAVSECTDCTALNTSEPRVDEVITEDNGEGAGDMAADLELIETSEPEPNVHIPKAGEENSVLSLDQEVVTMAVEGIYEAALEETNPTPANQDTPVGELPAFIKTEIIITEESSHKEVSTYDAVAVGDAAEISEQDKVGPGTVDEPSEKCESCPKEEFIIVEAFSDELVTTEKFPDGSPHDEAEPELIFEVTLTEGNNEIGEDTLSDVRPETVEDSEPSPATVSEEDEVIPEVTIDVLSQETEPSATTPQELAADTDIALEEEAITVTVFVPLSGEKEINFTGTEEPVEETSMPSNDETVAEEMNEEAIRALSNESEAVPESLEEDSTVQESSNEGEVPEVAICEESVEDCDTEGEKNKVSEDVSVQETVDESEPGPATVSEGDEMIPEAEIDVLPQEIEPNGSTPQELAADIGSPLEEEVISVTVFMPLSGEQEVNLRVLEEPVEEKSIQSKDEQVAEMFNEEALEALSNKSEAVVEDLEDHSTVQESSTEVEVAISDEAVEEIDLTEEKIKASKAEQNSSPGGEETNTEVMDNTLEEVSEDVLAQETVEESERSPALGDQNDEVIPEVTTDVLSQEIEPSATTPQDTAPADTVSPLEEDVINVTVFASPSGEEEVNLRVPEEPVEETSIQSKDEQVAEMFNEEALEALSNKSEAVVEDLEEHNTVQESSTEVEVKAVAFSEEAIKESDLTEEKIEASENVLAQIESTEIPEEIPLISEEPAEQNPNPCEEWANTEVMDNTLESITEDISEKLEVTENIVEEPEDAEVDVATGESEPCVLVQEEDNVAQNEALLNGQDDNSLSMADVKVLESIEPTDNNPVDSEDPVEESEQRSETEVLVVILQTPEDEVTGAIIHEADNSGDVSATVEENSETKTADEPMAEAVLEAIEEEIIAEEVVCSFLTSEEVGPEIIAEKETGERAEDEPRVNATDSTLDSQRAEICERMEMDALLGRLQSACKSVVEESAYKLGGLEISSLGYSITFTILVDPKTEQQ